MMSKIALIVVWLGLMVASAWAVYTVRTHAQKNVLVASDSEKEGETRSRASSNASRSRQISFSDVLLLQRQDERFQLLDRWIEGANVATLRHILQEMRRQPDGNLEVVAQRKVLARWVQLDPDSFWAESKEGKIDALSLVWAWLHEGDVRDLWQRIQQEEGSFFALTVESRLKVYWDIAGQKDAEFLKEMTGWSESEILPFRIAEIERTGDLDGLLALFKHDPDQLSEHWTVLAKLCDFQKNPMLALTLVDELTGGSQSSYLISLAGEWPESVDAEPLIERLMKIENLGARGAGFANFLESLTDREMAISLTKRLLEGEGGLMPYGVMECLKVQAGGEFVREILPHLDPVQQGWLRREMAVEWTYGLPEALEWSETLEEGHQRDHFLSVLFEHQTFEEMDVLEGWMKSQSGQQLKRLSVADHLSEYFRDGEYEIPLKLAEHLSVEGRDQVKRAAIERALYDNVPRKAAELLDKNAHLAVNDQVIEIYEKWHPLEPETAKAWAQSHGVDVAAE